MRTITGQVSGNDCHLPSQPESRRCYDQGLFDGHSISSTPLVIAGHRIMLVRSQSPGFSSEHTGPSIVTKKIRKSKALVVVVHHTMLMKRAILGTTITIIHHDQSITQLPALKRAQDYMMVINSSSLNDIPSVVHPPQYILYISAKCAALGCDNCRSVTDNHRI